MCGVRHSRTRKLKFPNIPVYVISVKSFGCRHKHIEKLSKQLGFKFEYIFDFDADALSNADRNRAASSMSDKSISNSLKHFEAQKRLVESNRPFGLVFEDDVIPFRGFVERLWGVLELAEKLDEGWLIFLGGADNKIDQRFLENQTLSLISREISTAEAYLIDRSSCSSRLTWLSGNIIDRQADHQIKFMDRELGVNHFWVSAAMVTQGSITGRFKTELDASRSKHSSFYLATKYFWNRLRRQIIPRTLRKSRLIGFDKS